MLASPVPFPFRLDGKVAVVTGGGTGIGAASAAVLAALGADVVVASRKVENLEKVAAEVAAASGRRAVAIRCDVRDEAECEALIERSVSELGRVDVLVNNAGGGFMHPFLDTPVERLDASVALNLRGPYVLSQLASRHMVTNSGGGAIVNISSAAGVTGAAGGAAYSAAKAGLQMLTRVVAAELGPKGIRANAIAVGAVASEGALRSWARFGADGATMGSVAALRRVGQPEDIAWGVAYLATDMSAFLSGQTIQIDGGPVLGGAPVEE